MSAGEGLPARDGAPEEKGPRRPERLLSGPRRRRFYGAARLAQVPALAALLPEPSWTRTRAE